MKLHDNTGFEGVVIVLRPSINLLKSQGLIELTGRSVRLANLQENCIPQSSQENSQKGAPDALAAMLRGYGEIEDLAFIRRDPAHRHKARDRAIEDGDPEIVRQVIARLPL